MTDRQTGKNSTFLTSMKHALHGIKTVIHEERNMKAHLSMAALAILISFISGLTALEWCFILLCIFLVLVMEILNTVVENLVDLLVKKEYHIEAKKAKDIAAAASCCISITAALIGLLIFSRAVFHW